MNLQGKKILILGLGISGVSSAKALDKLNAKILIMDNKSKEELEIYIEELKSIKNIEYYLGTENIDLNEVDIIVKSPGIPLENKILKEALDKEIEIVTDIELAYRISPNKFIAITGTNGKTTTTTLVGKIINNSGKVAKVTGNIGIGILWELVNSDEDDIFVIEASSFQLESTKEFKPNISVIINITPDHITWHKTFDNYIAAKKKIYLNQTKEDYTILNYDDPILREIENDLNSRVIYFSKKNILDCGVYVDGDYIVINDGTNITKVMKHEEIKIPGMHNLENSLASISVAYALGIDINVVVKTLRMFEGVEHRLEFVDLINNVKYYNDSKGTNPDSSIKAIETLNGPIILIAGGYDKGSDYKEFIENFNGKVKALILLGETKEKFKNTAENLGFTNIYLVDDMREAVEKCYELSEENDSVLLSPASASWDMYKNFEERGKDFKNWVKTLRRL